MGRNRKYRFFSADFETTVYENQERTDVWASACVELYTEDVSIFHSITETFRYFKRLRSNIIVYYHNLKFDGSFWLNFLITELQLSQAYDKTGDNETDVKWRDVKEMRDNTFKYSISDRGQWYNIIIKMCGYIIEIRDSVKLLPFSLKEIGEAFKTKHRKLEMEYTGFRYPGCEITGDEKKYISNDVLVLKEALEIMFDENHDKLTIGACCLSEFKKIIGGKEIYNYYFPDLYEFKIDSAIYGESTAGDWIRKSYRGAWVYLVRGKENKLIKNGITCDVNSLYPSMMHSESGNRYPVGLPTMWVGDYIPESARADDKYYFIRIKTRFYIKDGHLPFIQIKGSFLYSGTECLESSDVKDDKGELSPYYIDGQGEIHDTRVTLTLTQTDYKLIAEHYNLVDFEILNGCYFNSKVGLFDDYINIYKKIKMENKGAKRTLAKLFLNNLYGKMASSTDSSFKIAYEKEDNTLGFYSVQENEKKPGYIPVGSAIVSYARCFTIRAAQQNYYGNTERGFIYADTDSIHCDLELSELKGINIHETEFNHWSIESGWDEGIFLRAKSYVEHTTHEDGIKLDKPYHKITCAGMPEKCKNLLRMSIEGYSDSDITGLSESEIEFLKEKRKITDFTFGLEVPGKLIPKRITGGIILTETSYKIQK